MASDVELSHDSIDCSRGPIKRKTQYYGVSISEAGLDHKSWDGAEFKCCRIRDETMVALLGIEFQKIRCIWPGVEKDPTPPAWIIF